MGSILAQRAPPIGKVRCVRVARSSHLTHQASLCGSLDHHTVHPPSTLAPQRSHGLTHQSRLRCSGRTPCTSLESTEQMLALAPKKGGPCRSQWVPWGTG